MRVKAAVESAGCKLMTSNRSSQQRKPLEVHAIALLRTMIERDKDEMVTQVLGALAASPEGAFAANWHEGMIRQIFQLADRRKLTMRQLSGFITGLELRRLRSGAERMREQPQYAAMAQSAIFSLVLDASLDRYLAVSR